MILAWLLACGPADSVKADFDAARSRAQTLATGVPTTWEPDGVVRLSRPLVEGLVKNALAQSDALTRRIPIPLGAVTPTLRIDDLRLRPATKTCRADQGCFPVDVDLSGTLNWSTPLGSGEAPLTAGVALDLTVSVRPADKAFALDVLPTDVRRVDLSVRGWSGAAKRAAMGPLETWLDEALAHIPPYTATTFGDDLPIRAIRLENAAGGIVVGFLSAFGEGTHAVSVGPAPREGFDVSLAPDLLVGFARKSAFDAGPAAYDITAETTSFALVDDQYTLGLRLWGGTAWYRDFVAKGSLRAKNGAIELTTHDVQAGAVSAGAAAADPLVHLASGALPLALETVMVASLPAFHQTTGKTRRTKASLTNLTGRRGAVVLTGDVQFERAGRHQRNP